MKGKEKKKMPMATTGMTDKEKTVEELVGAFTQSFRTDWDEEVELTDREEVLRLATEATMKGRNNTYGPPTQDFTRAAEMMTAMGFTFINADGDVLDIQPHHVGMLMIAVKLSRATWSPDHQDHWVDIAGYAACAYECVNE
jgi:hypothetical protein